MGRAFEYRKSAKEKRWDKMSKLFPKLAKAITLAAKEGGVGIESNAKLRLAVQNAKAENMPKSNIEKAIQRASSKEIDDLIAVVYEGKGPHGLLTIVECATDKLARTVANIKAYFSKSRGGIVPNGSLDFMFSQKAVFEFFINKEINLEAMELALIDCNMEKMEKQDKKIFVYADYIHFGIISRELEKQGIEIQKAILKRIPNHPVVFSGEQLEEIDKMLDKIESDDDVQAVYTNIA